MPRHRRHPVQLSLPKTAGWGGRRLNAGRKPGPHPKTPHRARPRHYFGHPVHVTLRAALGSLRSQLLYPTVRIAISRATRHAPDRFRIVHYSVQSNHVHLIVEAAERRALTAGVHGLEARITHYVNELLLRRGSLWADRWHGRALKSPREVRNALVYVFGNFRKHSSRPVPQGVDPCSSGAWFHGFRGIDSQRGPPPLAGRAWPLGKEDEKVPVSPPVTWLLREGFLKAGRIPLDEAPRTELRRQHSQPSTASRFR
jgi:REP element-mobilizing transposase RayT